MLRLAASSLAVGMLLALAGVTSAQAQMPGESFQKLLEDAWDFDMRENPLWASNVGDRRFDDQLPRVTPADHQRRDKMQREFLRIWQALDRSELSASDRTNYDIFGRLLRDSLAEYEFKSHLAPITGRYGFHIRFPELARNSRFETVRDYDNYVARLAAFERYVDEHIELMRLGIEQRIVLPDVVLRGYEETIAPHIVDDPTVSLLYAPLTKMPERFSAADRKRLGQAARRAIAESVVPGYGAFLTFIKQEYLPACRGSIGASALPGGRAFYRYRVRRFTTLDLTPEQVHQKGLTEVERIRAEMKTIVRDLEFDGDVTSFVKFLRSDPQFYAKTPEELMKEVALVLKKMDGELPRLFGRLPRSPYGIRKVPAHVAPRTTTAYYQSPAGDGSRAGFYYVNTYNLKSRPLYEIEALSLHEAVPGHHLQLALQQELEDLPKFRRYAGFTAFVEGWALYAERLGLEAGFYQDPYRNFGRLSYEMWRACRLVVDTGIHYQGWTRQQAIDYMAANTALSLHNIAAEVDRYIGWPGQALAYKTGELKIRQLRQFAEESLDERFDLRAFHDVVLGSGSIPLTILDENVKAYVEKTRTEEN